MVCTRVRLVGYIVVQIEFDSGNGGIGFEAH